MSVRGQLVRQTCVLAAVPDLQKLLLQPRAAPVLRPLRPPSLANRYLQSGSQSSTVRVYAQKTCAGQLLNLQAEAAGVRSNACLHVAGLVPRHCLAALRRRRPAP